MTVSYTPTGTGSRSPALSLSILLTLALCIGATTAVFSVVYGVLFRPLPYRDPDGLLLLRTTWQDQPNSFSAGNWFDARRQATSFQYFVPGHGESFNLAGTDAPENVDGARVGAEEIEADYASWCAEQGLEANPRR